MGWLQDLANYGNSVDPTGMAGYGTDDITVQHMKNEGVLNSDGSVNNDYVIPESDIRNQDISKLDLPELLGLGDDSPVNLGGGGTGGGRKKKDALQDAMDLVDATAKYNNEWSAQQAEIQRDWQKMMSDTAHQREVADLKAAGLNPVLSSGGTGASTPSGAMGQTDTSNTRLIGEMAMSAIQGLGNAAVAGSAGAASGGVFGWLNKNKGALGTINNLIRTGVSIAKLFV